MKTNEEQIQKIKSEINELGSLLNNKELTQSDIEEINTEINLRKKEIDSLCSKITTREVSASAFKEISSKLLDETFKEFFIYSIFHNEKMSAIIEEVRKDQNKIFEYQKYKEFIILFLSKKYSSKKYKEEFQENHERWIYETGSKDPFSFENVLELRADLFPKENHIDPDYVRELLKSLQSLDLDELICKYKTFKKVSEAQEKDRSKEKAY
jgi:hypothetical protein